MNLIELGEKLKQITRMGNNNKLFVFHYKLVKICFLFPYWKWALWQKSNRCLFFPNNFFCESPYMSNGLAHHVTKRIREKQNTWIELALFSSAGEWSNSFDRDIIFESWLRQRSLLQRWLNGWYLKRPLLICESSGSQKSVKQKFSCRPTAYGCTRSVPLPQDGKPTHAFPLEC